MKYVFNNKIVAKSRRVLVKYMERNTKFKRKLNYISIAVIL